MNGMRTYGDPCGVARALDLVGERWGLLIVRELNFGPKRFTDLRVGLPTASPNVLSQRLDEMIEAGIVVHRRLPPPARVDVYELTEWGHELEPVLLALGRWGSRSPARHERQLSVDALALALMTTFDPSRFPGSGVTFGLTVGDDPFCLAVHDDRLDVTRGSPPNPDATITTDVATIRRLAFGDAEFVDALEAGTIHIKGDATVIGRLLASFPLQPVASP